MRPWPSGGIKASLRWIFKADVDPRAEKLLAALRDNPDGMTKSRIQHEVFSRHMSAGQVAELLTRLLAYRLIVRKKPASSGGRTTAHYLLNQW